jgi:MATE family multidrug resistance protein
MKPLPKQSRIIAEVKESLNLAVPFALAQLAQSTTGFVDTVMMGWLGSDTLAAGALGAVTFTFLLMIMAATVSAVSPLVATAYGAGNTQEVGQVVRQGFWLAVILAMPVILLLWFSAPLLRAFGQDPDNIALATTYLHAIVWGYLPGLGFAVLRNFVSALSKPRPVIVIIVAGTFINIAGNYVLMFGKLGFPAFGLAGIGWASTVSLWTMFVALGLYVLVHKQFAMYRVFHNLAQFDRHIFWQLLQTGAPIGMLAIVEAGLFTFTTFLMGQLGTVTLAAHQIALQSAAYTFMVPLGVSLATTVRVGQLIGQGNSKAARLAGYVGISLGGLFMAGMAVLFWIIPETVISLYIDINDPENAAVISQAKALLGVAAMFQIVDGVQVCAAGALRGLKDTRIPMLIGILAYWCIGFSCSYFFGFQLGFGGLGLWWGLAIGLLVAAIALTCRFSQLSIRIQTRGKKPVLHGS